MKALIKNVILLFISLAFTLLAAEGVLRFFPVSKPIGVEPVNNNNPILHFDPNQTTTWSRFPDFSMVNTIHSNNYGFINDQDYVPDGVLPLVAVIGDSYIEANMVPYADTLHGRLAKFNGDRRIYSFGVSGAPLSQYLAYARFASDEFKPSKIIFVIVGNDFDESLIQYKNSPGFHYFSAAKGQLALQRIDHPSPWVPEIIRDLIKKSSLAMYLIHNVQILHALQKIKMVFAEDIHYAGQTTAIVSDKKLKDSQNAVRAFLTKLPETVNLNKKDILFLVDGIRPDLYDTSTNAAAQKSYFGKMRNFFIEKTTQAGFSVIDMQPIFESRYAKNNMRFEFEKDGHWNSLGHEAAAEAIQSWLDNM